MVSPTILKKPKKLLLLFAITLPASLLLLLLFRFDSPTNDLTAETIPGSGVTAPNVGQIRWLPESAEPCTTPVPGLVTFVHSSPSHVPHRDAIRRTWGSPEGRRVKTVFVVGRSQNEKIWQRVLQEAEAHRDLILLDLADTYKNLTLKHLGGIKWVLSNCPDVPYILKSDDDIFIDTIRLLSMLPTLLGHQSGPRDTLVCHVIPEGSSPKRTGKWMVSKAEFPYDEYPEYCSGQAYFTRTSTLGKLDEVARSGAVPYFSIDDVCVTGVAARLAGVERQDLGVRFASNEVPVVEWMLGTSVKPCPWMVAEMSPYYWPKEAGRMWNKTLAAWKQPRAGDRL